MNQQQFSLLSSTPLRAHSADENSDSNDFDTIEKRELDTDTESPYTEAYIRAVTIAVIVVLLLIILLHLWRLARTKAKYHIPIILSAVATLAVSIITLVALELNVDINDNSSYAISLLPVLASALLYVTASILLFHWGRVLRPIARTHGKVTIVYALIWVVILVLGGLLNLAGSVLFIHAALDVDGNSHTLAELGNIFIGTYHLAALISMVLLALYSIVVLLLAVAMKRHVNNQLRYQLLALIIIYVLLAIAASGLLFFGLWTYMIPMALVYFVLLYPCTATVDTLSIP